MNRSGKRVWQLEAQLSNLLDFQILHGTAATTTTTNELFPLLLQLMTILKNCCTKKMFLQNNMVGSNKDKAHNKVKLDEEAKSYHSPMSVNNTQQLRNNHHYKLCVYCLQVDLFRAIIVVMVVGDCSVLLWIIQLHKQNMLANKP